MWIFSLNFGRNIDWGEKNKSFLWVFQVLNKSFMFWSFLQDFLELPYEDQQKPMGEKEDIFSPIRCTTRLINTCFRMPTVCLFPCTLFHFRISSWVIFIIISNITLVVNSFTKSKQWSLKGLGRSLAYLLKWWSNFAVCKRENHFIHQKWWYRANRPLLLYGRQIFGLSVTNCGISGKLLNLSGP